ncbi:MAG: penicillin acylase family protein, partial [Actinomycetota bacterium]
MFGLGYVSAEDRLFMMDVLRHLGRARLSEFLGPSPSNLAMDAAQFKVADYTEEELYGLGLRLLELDPVLGRQVVNDFADYSDGINAFLQEARVDPRLLPGEYAALQLVPDPWRPTDTAAVASVIGGALGVGGGTELENAAFLEALAEQGHTPTEARAIFDDLHMVDDPEAPTTTNRRFPWNQDLGPVDARSTALPDDAAEVLSSVPQPPSVIDGPFGAIHLAFPAAGSNALLVSARHSASGRPLAVFGPQTGYWSPEILMEVDVHAPGLHGRGAAFPGISLYVLLGRGPGWGWSATSAGADQVDIVAHELCDPMGGAPEPNSQHYLRGKRCVPMYTRTDTFVAKPSAGGVPSSPTAVLVSLTTERTHLGIVQSRGTVDGKAVAFVRRRASYGAEVDSAFAFVEIMNPESFRGARDFQRAFGRFSFTFNWFYVDAKDIAFQLGGLNPIRAPGVDLDLPIWAGKRWDWRGFQRFGELPKALNPGRGYFANWNNWQAPGFRVSDGAWSYGPVHRSLLLDDRVRREVREGDVTMVELVQAMEDAATVDLRGDKVLPWMLEVVGHPADGRLGRAVRLLGDWHRNGAH